MGRIFQVLGIACAFTLLSGVSRAQSEAFEDFRSALGEGDHLGALNIIASGADTTSMSSDYLASKIRSIVDRGSSDTGQGCSEGFVQQVYTKALISYASEANVVLREQQAIGAQLMAQYEGLDSSCRDRAQELILVQMNALPGYAGALGVAYMDLFPLMSDEEVGAFLSGSTWLRPMMARQQRLLENYTSPAVGAFLLESLAIVVAVSYADMLEEHSFPGIPAPIEYVDVARDMAQQALRTKDEEVRPFSSLFALSYMVLMSDDLVAEEVVTEENITGHLDLVIDVVSHWRGIDLPKQLRVLVDQLSPVYYSAFIRVYNAPFGPDDARAAFLRGAELIAKDEDVISSLLGPCQLAQTAAMVRSHSLMFNYQITEGSSQLLDLFTRADSISIACALDLGTNAYTDTWKSFQSCYMISLSLSEYQAGAAMMAIAAETLKSEEYANTRDGWMDFLLEGFDNSIRHDTITNSISASRHMVDFVRAYVNGKEDPYTDQQALFVLLHLAKLDEIIGAPVPGRCSLIERVSKDVAGFGASLAVADLVELLRVDCSGQSDQTISAARAFVAAAHGEAFVEAQIFVYSILFANTSYKKRESDYDRYIELHKALYGGCHRYAVGAVAPVLLWYSADHGPAEVKKFLDDRFSLHYQPECQALISWLPSFMIVRNAVSADPALKAILDVNMRSMFRELRPEDCVSYEETEAYVDWKNSSHSSLQEAESNARESLVVLYASHGGDEEAWFGRTTPYVRQRYRRTLMLTYSTLCTAFGGYSDIRADSLCRYASMMEELLLKEPALAADFEVHVQERRNQCEALGGLLVEEFTTLLSQEDLMAMDGQRFNSYIKWYGQITADTVMAVRLRWNLTDREALMRELRPIIDHHGFMLAQAKRISSLSAYCELLTQWAFWTPSTGHQEYLLSVLESIYERYPEMGETSWNTISLMHTNSDRSIIIQDRYRNITRVDYPYLELIALSNSLFDQPLWVTLDTGGRSVMCKQVLSDLSQYEVKNTNDADAWHGLARMAALIILEDGTDGQVVEMERVMSSRLKVLRQLGRFKEGTLGDEEYKLLKELLRARVKPQILTPTLERALFDQMKKPLRGDDGVDGVHLLRGYAAVLHHHPEVEEDSDILTQGLESISFRLWYDYLNKDERMMTRYIQLNLNAFWKVVRASVMDRDVDRLPAAFTQLWVETLWLQREILGQAAALEVFESIGFDEALFRRLEETYWSAPKADQEKPDEFRTIASMYEALIATSGSPTVVRPCRTSSSTERYRNMVLASEQESISTLQTNEALHRYAKLACTSTSTTSWTGIDDHADTWLRFPLRAAILEFDRDEGAGVYRLTMRTEDSVKEHVLGNIEAMEESWRKWASEMEADDDLASDTSVPPFWSGVVSAALSDTTIKQFILVPDGIYYNVNPVILPLEGTGQIRVDVVVDLDAYLRPEVPTNRIGSVLLVGGLDYGGKEGQRFALADRLRSDSGLDRGSGWVKLPATEREVHAIAEKLRDKHVMVDLVTGTAGTAERMKELAFPQAIHLATHGFVDQQGVKERSAGLVLSGANSSGAAQQVPGSYLYAEDIRELDLFACDLVVLSACRTALSSEGYGQGDIIKAFKDAGVAKVVASSWAVPDECTSLLMEHFYDYYLSGVPASQALAEAQRKVALRFPRKRDWAAFMVYQ